MKVLAVLLTLFLAACAPKAGDSGSSQGLTVLRDWGTYYDAPLDFTSFKLNTPNVITWTVSDGAPLVTCELTITLEGTTTAGRLKTTNARTVWVRPQAMTTKCQDLDNLDKPYLVTEAGLVVDNFLFERGNQ